MLFYASSDSIKKHNLNILLLRFRKWPKYRWDDRRKQQWYTCLWQCVLFPDCCTSTLHRIHNCFFFLVVCFLSLCLTLLLHFQLYYYFILCVCVAEQFESYNFLLQSHCSPRISYKWWYTWTRCFIIIHHTYI